MGARLVERRCGYCNGTGKVSSGEIIETMVDCPVSQGFPYVRVPSNFVKCPKCGGTGRRKPAALEILSRPRRCDRCRGTGWCEPPLAYR